MKKIDQMLVQAYLPEKSRKLDPEPTIPTKYRKLHLMR